MLHSATAGACCSSEADWHIRFWHRQIERTLMSCYVVASPLPPDSNWNRHRLSGSSQPLSPPRGTPSRSSFLHGREMQVVRKGSAPDRCLLAVTSFARRVGFLIANWCRKWLVTGDFRRRLHADRPNRWFLWEHFWMPDKMWIWERVRRILLTSGIRWFSMKNFNVVKMIGSLPKNP